MQSLFLIGLFIIFYTYLGYAILLFLIVKILRLFRSKNNPTVTCELPTVTLIVAAYNEAYCIEEKISNTLALTYPKNKLTIVFVTDGSSDETPEIVAKYPTIQLLHQPERNGKIVAVHRAMQTVGSEITVFTDANTLLNESALEKICQHYQDPKVGAVAGEKRVEIDNSGDATAGEGFYWKYESKLKAWDSELNTVVGAAGELFSIKTALYIPVPSDTILDDFMISMLIAKNGYRIIYEPEAFALETASANTKEELKRKIRIAAGGIQSFLRLTSLLNPFKYPVLSFQYLSHRILRWTIAPVLMVFVFVLNWFLIFSNHNSGMFVLLLVAQNLFYALALLGWILQSKSIKLKLFFIPYYFCMMNYAILAGLHRYFFASQSVLWEKAKRK